MSPRYTDKTQKTSEKIQWKREDVADIIIDFERARQKQSQRQFAKNKGISRSTLQHWLARKESIDASLVLIEFIESPVGTAFIHRIVTAAHFAFTKDGVASIHNVSTFLNLSGLSPFVASSYSTQQRASNKMDDFTIEFEEFVRPTLAQNMPAKKISLAEDETFHPQICAVSMEPVSNFIIVEKHVENREGATWNQVVLQALRDLPVEVIQVTSDEGRGLINHTCISIMSQELLSILTQPDGPFSEYAENEIKKLEKAAKECAQIFQRSSSCVEGRNAQLSLRHHGIHKLSDHSLKAQTIIHNYYRRNRDGTTPAERFFEAKHIDLFEWLLEKMDYPARPRKRLNNAA